MSTRMQQRRGTAAQWISRNAGQGPILNSGEIGYETDTNKFKIGDGINHWVDLPYFVDGTAAAASISSLVDGAPELLNTLNELAAALGDDADFVGTTTAALALKQDQVSGVSDTEISYLNGVTSSIQAQLNTRADATALSDHEALSTNVHGIADTSLLATTEYVDTAVSNSAVDQASLAGVGIDYNATTDQFDIDATIATVDYVDGAIAAFDSLPTQTGNDGKFLQTDGSATSWATVDLSTKQDKVTGVSDTEIGQLDGVTSSIQTQLNAKVNSSDIEEISRDTLGNALFSGNGITITPNDPTDMITVEVDTAVVQLRVADVSDIEIGHLNGVTSGIQAQIDAKAPIASPTFTGTVSGVSKSMVGLGSVDNTADADKPVSTAQASAIATAKSEAIADATAQVSAVIDGAPAALNTLNELAAAINDDASYAATITSSLATKAPIESPTFTGTVSGITKSMVGLNNVNNTADANKPVSSATQTALDAKLDSTTAATTYAPIASPTFTGTVSGVTKSMVGLSNVDNTSDSNKPVSSATQTALDAKLSKSGGIMTGALELSGAPTIDLHAATKLYVDNLAAGINFHQAAHVATTANLSANYNNGTDGVGATLTATANGAWTILDEHTSFTQYDRVLVKDQTDPKQNGIYILSDLGGSNSKWILTRASDADNNPAGEMKNGDFVLVLNGTVNASYGFVNNSSANPIAIGTDSITYTPFNSAKTIAAGNGLLEATPGVLSIDTSITQARVSGVSDTEIGYLDGVTSAIQTQLNNKISSATAASTYAPLASPTFTGTVAGITKSMVGLGSVDNTADAEKPVSAAQQTALNLKAPLDSAQLTGTPTAPTATAGTSTTQVATTAFVGTAVANLVASAPAALDTLNELATALGNDASFSTTVTNSLAAKAPLASPTFTGTVSGITKTMVGLANVDNTSDANKPVSTATQTALDAKSTASKAETLTNKTIALGSGNLITTNGFDIEEAIFFYSMIN